MFKKENNEKRVNKCKKFEKVKKLKGRTMLNMYNVKNETHRKVTNVRIK